MFTRWFLLGGLILLMLPVNAQAGKRINLPALAPGQLVDIRPFLIGAKRVEVTLLSGETHRGRIESVTESGIVLHKSPDRNRGSWRMDAIAIADIRHMRLFHARRRGWRSDLGKAVGTAVGISVAVPLAYRFAGFGSATGTLASLFTIPVIGRFAGERLARGSQETFVPILHPPAIPALSPEAVSLHYTFLP